MKFPQNCWTTENFFRPVAFAPVHPQRICEREKVTIDTCRASRLIKTLFTSTVFNIIAAVKLSWMGDWGIIEGNLPSFHCCWSKIDSTLSSFINLRSTEAIWLEHKTRGDMPGLYKSACLLQMPFDILGAFECQQWNREWCHYSCIQIMIIVRCSSSHRSRIQAAILKPFSVKWLRFNSRVHCKFISLSVHARWLERWAGTFAFLARYQLCTLRLCHAHQIYSLSCARLCHVTRDSLKLVRSFISKHFVPYQKKPQHDWCLCVRPGPGRNKSGLRVSVLAFSEYLFSIMR